jgi:hypothetical protein
MIFEVAIHSRGEALILRSGRLLLFVVNAARRCRAAAFVWAVYAVVRSDGCVSYSGFKRKVEYLEMAG